MTKNPPYGMRFKKIKVKRFTKADEEEPKDNRCLLNLLLKQYIKSST